MSTILVCSRRTEEVINHDTVTILPVPQSIFVLFLFQSPQPCPTAFQQKGVALVTSYRILISGKIESTLTGWIDPEADSPTERANYKLLGELPPCFARRKAYKDLAAVDMSALKGKHDQTMDLTTIREYMILVRAFFQYAVDEEYIEKNSVLKRMVPDKKKRKKEQRLPFTADDLELILNVST